MEASPPYQGCWSLAQGPEGMPHQARLKTHEKCRGYHLLAHKRPSIFAPSGLALPLTPCLPQLQSLGTERRSLAQSHSHLG